ncbi:hypothetical protein [Herbiconiux solani]|uniref:hypothetical protein n=1 Tax=Herbiconiux solani TaxID=661329 RepID=UPI00082403AE|nr:hypothetical protein [Herbiconiux solani]
MALEADDLVLPHRGLEYTLSGGAPEWAIGRDGVLFGYLVIRSVAGEEGEPVYTTRLPDGTIGNVEGSDWEQIVKAMLNEVDPAIPDASSGSSMATP